MIKRKFSKIFKRYF